VRASLSPRKPALAGFRRKAYHAGAGHAVPLHGCFASGVFRQFEIGDDTMGRGPGRTLSDIGPGLFTLIEFLHKTGKIKPVKSGKF